MTPTANESLNPLQGAPGNRAERRALLREGHSPEQMAKWAAERRERELAAIAASTAEREAEKGRTQRNIAAVDTSTFGQHFTADEKDSIKQYYLSGDWRGALAEGRYAAVSAIERALRATGVEIEHTSASVGEGGEGKSIYAKVGDEVVRISDHELPETPKRDNDRSQGLTGKWDREVIVTDWKSTPLEDYLDAVAQDREASARDFNEEGMETNHWEIEANRVLVEVANIRRGEHPDYRGLTDGVENSDDYLHRYARSYPMVAVVVAAKWSSDPEKYSAASGLSPERVGQLGNQLAKEAGERTSSVGRQLNDTGLSPQQQEAVDAFRENNGRNWKSALRTNWERANYPGMSVDHAAALQQVRNTLGPEWLTKYRAPEKEAKHASGSASQDRERRAVTFAVQSIQREAAAKGQVLSAGSLEQAGKAVQERFARDPSAIERTLHQREQHTTQTKATAQQTEKQHGGSVER